MKDTIITQLDWYMLNANASKKDFGLFESEIKTISEYIDLYSYTVEELDILKSYLLLIISKERHESMKVIGDVITDIIDKRKEVLNNENSK